MLDAFKESEAPLRDVEKRRKYMSYVTHSNAALLVTETIYQVVSP